jgi:D-alanyl-D-alanine carboxypeptidase/D-alanyl-D-alanine-endopeptidase (penicillin-binding protein 4)
MKPAARFVRAVALVTVPAFASASAFAFASASASRLAAAGVPQSSTAIVAPGAPGAPWTAAAVAKLDADLDATLAAAPGLRGAHVGVLAVDTATGDVLYERHADEAFQPASTLKLLVGSAALERLGPAFRFETTLDVLAGRAGEPPSIVLRASGDPTLSSGDVVAAAALLGLRAVDRAYVDASAFDDKPYPEGWTWDDFAQDYAAPVSAATLDENTVVMGVKPGLAELRKAEVRFEDGHAMRPYETPCDGMNAPYVTVVSHVITGPADSVDTVDVERSSRGCPVLVGSIPLGAAEESVAVAVPNPPVALADALGRALDRAGIAHFDPVGTPIEALIRPPMPAKSVRIAWTHDSQPLTALLGPRFWIPSDNLFGELLLKELGLVTAGAPGTTDNGIAYEKTWLVSIGVDPATVTLADGCGMSQYDRITPRDLVAILQHDWNGPNRQLVLDSLPVGGARGTIEGIAGTEAAGRVFAKTGSMMHVRGLAGYLATRRHGAVTFAFNVDDWLGDYPALAATRAAVLTRIIED